MSVTTVAFFNNKAGVGKTSLVYHLAWMYADLGVRVVAADLDPQANLTSSFLDEDLIERLWADDKHDKTIFGFVRPLVRAVGDITEPHLEYANDQLALIVGDLALSRFEDQLSEVWPKCLDRDERAFRITSAFWRIMQLAAKEHEAQIVLIDLGPNLGAINRAALISADYVVIPLGPDLYSLQGLRNLGPKLRAWRQDWSERKKRNPVSDLDLPSGQIQPLGYLVMQHSVRLDRPVKSYERWISRMPSTYRTAVLDEQADDAVSVQNDPLCLALLKHYRSLMPMAQESRKPMFHLRSADGAIGAHQTAATAAGRDFAELAEKILQRIEEHKTTVGRADRQ